MAPLLSITFESPNIESFRELISHVVYSSGKQLKFVAAELDMSPPQLSMILSGTDGRSFPADKIPDLIRITAPKGHEIIYWLIERFLSKEEDRKAKALSTIEAMLPQMMAAMERLK